MDPHEIVQVNVRMPRRLREAAEVCSRSVGQSVNQFAVQAVAQRVKNWTDPITGERLAKTLAAKGELHGWSDEPETKREAQLDRYVCTHGSHNGIPASECKYQKLHQRHWLNVDTLTSFVEDTTDVADHD